MQTNLTKFFYVRLSVNKTTSDTSKVAQNRQFLIHLTSKCASPHKGVHFFAIESPSNRQKVARTWCALQLFTATCAVATQQRALFRRPNFQSAPNLTCFVHSDLQMCFAPQRHALSRHLSFQKWSEPDVFRHFLIPNVLCATTACNFSSLIWPASSAPAALASLLFNPPEPQNIRKTQCFATFLHFRAPASSLF